MFFLCVSVHQPLPVPFHYTVLYKQLHFAVSEVVFVVLVATLHRFEGKKGNWKMLTCVNCFCMVYLGCPVNEETPNNT